MPKPCPLPPGKAAPRSARALSHSGRIRLPAWQPLSAGGRAAVFSRPHPIPFPVLSNSTEVGGSARQGDPADGLGWVVLVGKPWRIHFTPGPAAPGKNRAPACSPFQSFCPCARKASDAG